MIPPYSLPLPPALPPAGVVERRSSPPTIAGDQDIAEFQRWLKTVEPTPFHDTIDSYCGKLIKEMYDIKL